MPFLATTSERVWRRYPLARSPGGALQNGGVGVSLQALIWAIHCCPNSVAAAMDNKAAARRSVRRRRDDSSSAPLGSCNFILMQSLPLIGCRARVTHATAGSCPPRNLSGCTGCRFHASAEIVENLRLFAEVTSLQMQSEMLAIIE
jgi:hypothetical protein